MAAGENFYRRLVRLSAHRHAQLWLFLVALTEAVFLPVPPDALLAPMVLARPRRWLYYTLLCTTGSVLGGVSGYMLGLLFFELIEPLLLRFPSWNDAFLRAEDLYARWGLWIILVAGFTPLPYKFFVIAAGVAHASLPALVIASLLGRGSRFLLVALISYFFGTRARHLLRRWVSALNWITLAALAALLSWYFFLRH